MNASTFVAAYARTAPWGAPPAALRWYAGVILVAKHAQKCVKRMKTDGDRKIQRLIAASEAILAGHEPWS